MNFGRKERRGAREFKAGEGDEVQAFEDVEASLVVSDQTSEAGLPGEGALDDPSSREEDEAALGLGEPDHIEPDAVGRRVRCWGGAGVAVVHEGDFDRVTGRLLDASAELGDLGAV